MFKDFTPITTGAKSNTILTAHVSTPFNNIKELVAYAKANAGKLNYASFGAGSTSHLNGERFSRIAGIQMVHVPYKGSGDAMKDHLSGVVQLFFDGPTRSIVMITVSDQVRPWLMPSNTFAATTHAQLGATMSSTGTGTATSHPATRTGLRPNRSEKVPAK